MKKKKKPIENKKFTIAIQNCQFQFHKAQCADFETPVDFSSYFSLDLSFLLFHAAANFQQTWVNCWLLSVSMLHVL